MYFSKEFKNLPGWKITIPYNCLNNFGLNNITRGCSMPTCIYFTSRVILRGSSRKIELKQFLVLMRRLLLDYLYFFIDLIKKSFFYRVLHKIIVYNTTLQKIAKFGIDV